MSEVKTEWPAEWLEYAKKVMSAGCTMGEVAVALNNKFSLTLRRSAVVEKIEALKASGEFGELPEPAIWQGKPITVLVAHWHNGISTPEISNIYGVAGSTIRAKANEYGLKVRDFVDLSKNKKGGPCPTVEKYFGRKTFPSKNALGLTFEELKHGQCRFVIGDSDFRFCGLPVKDGSSVPYCPTCKKIMYIPPR